MPLPKFPIQIILKRSKSLCCLPTDSGFCNYRLHSRSVSESSVEYMVHSDTEDEGKEVFRHLERKVDRLSDLFLEQCRLLSEMKEEISLSKTLMEQSEQLQNNLIVEEVKTALAQCLNKEIDRATSTVEKGDFNTRARSLLDAIEFKRAFCLDREIRDVLVEFLQSEELCNHIATTTAEAVRDTVRDCFSRDMSRLYRPLLERSHRRLARQVMTSLEDAFIELEENSGTFSTSIYKISLSLRRALERHQSLLEKVASTDTQRAENLRNIVEDVLQKELKLWHQQTFESFLPAEPEFDENCLYDDKEILPLEYSPLSPPQPADSECSVIDQLMMSAEINKLIQDGDVNGSFERALSAGDLALVMTACRAVNPAQVFTPPCQISQSVLLSLVQQLATDMVHETQLKCRYLEEALINIKTADPTTKPHLPMVVGEIRKHLTKFLEKYPAHVASRRVILIVMAADYLLK